MTERLRDAIDMLRGELRHGIEGPGAELTLRVAAAEVCRVAEAAQEADAMSDRMIKLDVVDGPAAAVRCADISLIIDRDECRQVSVSRNDHTVIYNVETSLETLLIVVNGRACRDV